MLQTHSSPPSEARSPPPARRSDSHRSYTRNLDVTLGDLQLQAGPWSYTVKLAVTSGSIVKPALSTMGTVYCRMVYPASMPDAVG
jgi:hypothetical protein